MEEILLREFSNFGTDCIAPDAPCGLAQASWLGAQLSNKKSRCLTLYVCSLPTSFDKVCIYLRYPNGENLAPKDLELIQSLDPLASYTTPESEIEDPEYVNLGLYPKFLIEKKFVAADFLRKKKIQLDIMFGGTEQLILDLRENLKLDITLYNLCSKAPRLNNYIADPTGTYLKWYTTLADNSGFFAAIDPTGRTLGVYDLEAQEELSSSGLGLILLYNLAVLKKKKGTILATHTVSERIKAFIANLGLTLELIEAEPIHFYTALQKKRKSPVLLYLGPRGQFWFKNDILEFNATLALLTVVETCNQLGLTPAKTIDFIQKAKGLPTTVSAKMILNSLSLHLRKIVKFLNESAESCYIGTSTWTFRYQTAFICIVEKPIYENVEIFIEHVDHAIVQSVVDKLMSLAPQ